jgi:hypothetical protein
MKKIRATDYQLSTHKRKSNSSAGLGVDSMRKKNAVNRLSTAINKTYYQRLFLR